MKIIVSAALIAAISVPIASGYAQVPPLTIAMVRTSAAVGTAPSVADVELLRKCPDMRPSEPMGMYQDAEAMDTARRLRIPVGALWLRRNDGAIERCLAKN